MTLTVNAKAFTADKFGPDSIGYFGPAHSGNVKDDIQLARTNAKPTALFSGVNRASIKLTRTNTLTGSLTPTGEMIGQVSFSIPVGSTGADVDSMLNDLGSYLSSASAKLLAKNLQINY